MQDKKYEARMSNEERLAVLETTILNINSALLDIKQEIRHLSDKMDERFAIFERYIDKRFEIVDRKFEAVDKRFDAVDKKFEAVDKRFEAIDKKFEAMDRRFDTIYNRLWANFIWTITMVIGLAGLIAHAQHWI